MDRAARHPGRGAVPRRRFVPSLSGRTIVNITTALPLPTHLLSEKVTAPLLGARKIYVTGSRQDIRVPMREIALTPSSARYGGNENLSLVLYDTSGIYTDPQATIDLACGLPRLRTAWIDERADTVEAKLHFKVPESVSVTAPPSLHRHGHCVHVTMSR